MAMACMRALVISIIFLASSIRIGLPMVTAAVPEEAPGSGGYQLELIHVDANGNFSREELARRALDRARLRAAMLSAAAQGEEEEDDTNNLGSSFSVPVQYSTKNYIMELKMGDSTVPGSETTMLAVADTGSDLIWTNQLMRECIRNPSFTPTNAPCAEDCRDKQKHCNTCVITKSYGPSSKKKNVTGFTGMQTVALPTGTGTAKKKVDLLCAMEWSQKMLPEAGQGVVGLSRGPMSLVRQLGVTQFSYCLTDPLDKNLRSPLWLGPNAQSAAGGKDGWRTTALAEISTKDSKQPEWAKNDYYVVLNQICIGGECSGPLKQEDFWLRSSQAHGSKGLMLVDSGNTYMHLDHQIFEALKTVLHEALGVNVVIRDEMNCFDQAADHPTPDLVLKFPGADMSIPWASYVEEGAHGSCLYILSAGASILGNFQQHNVAMLYDLAKKELSFKRVHDCGSTN